jgi:hypothetical protein
MIRYTYTDPDRTPQGIQRLRLSAGKDGDAGVFARGNGPLLGLPTLPLALPVAVQVHRENGLCFGATYTDETVRRNGPTSFRGGAAE